MNYLRIVFPKGQELVSAVRSRDVEVRTASGERVNGIRSVDIHASGNSEIVEITLRLHAVVREDGAP